MVAKSQEALVQEFAKCVVAQTECIKERRSTEGNRKAKRYIAAFQALTKMPGGRDALASLFSDDRPDVRATAAAFLLRHRNEEALAVLHEVASGVGLIAFEAQEAIKRWEEGTWALDTEE